MISPLNASSIVGEYVNGLSASLKLTPSTTDFLSDMAGEPRRALNGVNPDGRGAALGDVEGFGGPNWADGRRDDDDGVGRMALKD